MTAILKQWGNSIGLRLPKQIVRDAALKPGSTFTVDVEPTGALRLVPVRARPSLEELCARITDENRHPETQWGRARGAVFIERAASAALDEVQNHVQQLIGR